MIMSYFIQGIYYAITREIVRKSSVVYAYECGRKMNLFL